MIPAVDETHDKQRRSWVESANRDGAPFPIQNLPLGVFRRTGDETPRIGTAIGDRVLDVAAAGQTGLLSAAERAVTLCHGQDLNALMAAGPEVANDLRRALSRLLDSHARAAERGAADDFLYAAADVEMLLPAEIGNYTDFYASIDHATNVGRLLRPDNPLLPNYKWVPIGYHGRASSIRPSGAPVVRPNGQVKPADALVPAVGPTRRLDYEAELGFFVGAGNRLGEPVGMAHAAEHLFGVCLLNDWSARDVQAWEYQPLGPFLAKSFATTVSPWIVTMAALAPFRSAAKARADGDPAPLPYLANIDDQRAGGLDINVDVLIGTAAMRRAGAAPHRLATVNASDLYWTPAQMLTHHTMNGCDLRPGDLLGSGTISGSGSTELGSLMELTKGGQAPLELPNGERRAFLADGDEIILRGWCARVGYISIGLGECRGTVAPAIVL